jgi:hypothetical protein
MHGKCMGSFWEIFIGPFNLITAVVGVPADNGVPVRSSCDRTTSRETNTLATQPTTTKTFAGYIYGNSPNFSKTIAMQEVLHVRIKKDYAEAIIIDLQKMEAVEIISDDVPAWQMDLVKERMEEYKRNPIVLQDFDNAMIDIETEL